MQQETQQRRCLASPSPRCLETCGVSYIRCYLNTLLDLRNSKAGKSSPPAAEMVDMQVDDAADELLAAMADDLTLDGPEILVVIPPLLEPALPEDQGQ